jgi:hypothetical protein
MASDDTTGHLYTAWHPLFVWLIQHVLTAEWWDVLPEAQLTLEPQRADAIIIRRKDVAGTPEEPEYLRSVLSALRPHNVIHFKGATDELEVADVFQVIAYTAQWMNLRGVTEPGDVSIRVVASSISPRFLRQVKAMGGAVEATDMRGVLEGHLGVFPLRVVDAVAAYPSAHEHLLYSVSSDVLRDPSRLPPLDAREMRLYHLLAQSVRQDRRDPTKKRRVMKDRELVDMTMDQVRRMIVESLTPEELLASIAGLDADQVLSRYKPEERLRGIPPEERLRDVPPEHAILALSDTMLAQLPETLLVGLPEEIQAKVRARLGR